MVGKVIIEGPVASGITSTANPMIIGGVAGDGKARSAAVDSAGNVSVTGVVTGTVTTVPPANASTNITEVGGATLALGATIMADSVPVAFSTDQSPLGVTGSVSATGTVTANIGTTGGLALDTSVTDLQKDAIGASYTAQPVVIGISDTNQKVRVVQGDFHGNIAITAADEISDAFGRFRVSSPITLFEAQFQYDNQPLLFTTSLSGTGTVAKTSGESSLTLATGGTASGATAINQTKIYLRYQPGKSELIAMTGILGIQKTNVRSRIGYFEVDDGFYFQMDGSGTGTDGASVNIRSSTSGSPVNTTILQANWNLDKLNGTGSSGATLDFSKTQIFVIDFQWLGVGRIRFGFYINGALVYCHQVFNDNTIVSPYTNTANLPLRAEITNTGTAASTTTMKQICMTVLSEGGVEHPNSFRFVASNGATSISVSTRRPVLSIQPKTTFNSITNRVPLFLVTSGIAASSGSIYWEIVANGTLTGASFSSVDSHSGTNFDVAATAISGGIVLEAGFASGGGDTSRGLVETSLLGLVPITLDFAGTTGDILSIVCTAFTGSVSTNAEMGWSETR